MKVVVSGSHGLVGSALMDELQTWGYQPLALVRKPTTKEAIFWDYQKQECELKKLEGAHAVIHLAGSSIADGRWTARRKKEILESRSLGTEFLCEQLAELQSPPKVLICASAIGYYGDRGDLLCTEETENGIGFLPDVCKRWEMATRAASAVGIRVVNLRIGVVLSKKGGALAKMLTPFRLGLGGVVGSGEQYMSWVYLPDVIGAIQHAMTTESLFGPVNVVSPEPVTNFVFTKSLGKALHRWTLFPLPAFLARLLMGEMADELLLSSTRVSAEKLQQSGYNFQAPTLQTALAQMF